MFIPFERRLSGAGPVVTKAIVIIVLIIILWPFRQVVVNLISGAFPDKTEDEIDPSKETVLLNGQLSSQPNSFPLYVQTGYVEFSEKDNFVSYRFGAKGKPDKYLAANGFLAQGIYVKTDSIWQKVDDLSKLKSGDIVDITYYEAPAYSDSGVKGKTILGIVDQVKRNKWNLEIIFLDDPNKTVYALPTSFDWDTEDTLGLYQFKENLEHNAKRGRILRISVDDELRLKSLTFLAPPIDIVWGKVVSIGIAESGETTVTLEDRQIPYLITDETKVVKRGEPNLPQPISMVTRGKLVYIVYYNRQNDYVVLSLDYQ